MAFTLDKWLKVIRDIMEQIDRLENDQASLSGQVDRDANRLHVENLRAKVEELRAKYLIEEEQLIATDASVITPRVTRVFLHQHGNSFRYEYQSLMWYIAHHFGVEFLTSSAEAGENPGRYAELWGYEAELGLVEMLWSSARVVFGRHLEPSVDRSLSDQVNAYNLRQAGMLRKDIAVELWGENTPALRSRAQRLYVAECKRRGEQPALEGLGTDAKTYRDAYASGFVSSLYRRLVAARDAASTGGTAVEFPERRERVREAMYQRYPHLRPVPVSTDVDTTPAKPAKTKAYKGPTKADLKRWARESGPAAQAGRAAGGQAALRVDLGHSGVGRIES